MPRNQLWILGFAVLAASGLLPVVSSGAPPASTEKVIYAFLGGSDGALPMSHLVLDSAGNLYGTTSSGGSGTACNLGCGTVFELERSKDGWKERVLHSFSGLSGDGVVPQAGLIFDRAGNLYGTTAGGGSKNWGTVFVLKPNSHGGWNEEILYSFTGLSDGSNPNTDLVFDTQGNLYGTASTGGTSGCGLYGFGCGTVFELTPQANGTWKETTLYIFAGRPNDGGTPSSVLTFDSEGNIYGTTSYGGKGTCRPGEVQGCGTIFKLTPSHGTWTESLVYDFLPGGDKAVYPSGGLFFDTTGDIYGTSQAGGDGLGTFFELRKPQDKGWQQIQRYIFLGSPDGWQPMGRLAMDGVGNLFGVTSAGGNNSLGGRGLGLVFELRRSRNRWMERVLHTFSFTDGALPYAGPAVDSQGHLYGTTEEGGNITHIYQHGCGTVYEILP